MPKIYRRFTTPLELIAEIPFVEKLYKQMFSDEDYRTLTYLNKEAGAGGMGLVGLREQLQGAFQP